ncbi:hypothetical protein [Streptomyces sp. NPDC088725]|uniref:hypothetical protein n=1 Tax=Streptomyces sp. NPDC088725 TaxID=3365873 RepID=UPI00382220D8
MTTARGTDGWTASVRQRIGLGRLLPLGEAADGAWLAEQAAAVELRRAMADVAGGTGVRGAVLGRLRIGPGGPHTPEEPAVPSPPSALPPGLLHIEAEFAAVSGEPLPVVADRLRTALYVHAEAVLGLRVAQVDLRVTALLAGAPEAARESSEPIEPYEGHVGSADAASPHAASPHAASPHAASPEGPGARAVVGVPGVAHLTDTLGEPVHTTTPGHVRVELATAPGHRPLDVARAVRAAVAVTMPGTPSVAVVITAVEAAAPDGL